MDLERRLKRDLVSYCLLDPLHFESIRTYAPSGPGGYLPELEAAFEAGTWQFRKVGIWYSAAPAEPPALPAQGFKLHVAATSVTAPAVMARVLPVLRQAGVPFKLVVDPRMLDFLNGKNANRSHSGKFFTIYPPTQEACLALARQLHEATRDLDGPYILTDRRYPGSRVLFYRYGGFDGRHPGLNVYGERVPLLTGPDRVTVEDRREPRFSLPAWVQDPFPAQEPEVPSGRGSGQVILGDRFRIEKAIDFSNAGGVYLGTDTRTGARVIIKEARPHVNESRSGRPDAICTLQREFEALRRVEDAGVAPRPLALVQAWEHWFLVEERLEGMPLTAYRASLEFALLPDASRDEAKATLFSRRILQIGSNLIRVVEAYHRAGVLLGDLSPSNVFIDPETLKVRTIDLEGSVFTDQPPMASWTAPFTEGYASPHRRKGNRPRPEDDVYSIGCILNSLVFPAQEYLTLNPEARGALLAEVHRETGLPPRLVQGLEALLAMDLPGAKACFDPPVEETAAACPEPLPKHREDQELARVVDGITSHLLAAATPGRRDRLWPSDYRVFSTNGLNLAFGAAGILLYLRQVGAPIPSALLEWFLKPELTPESHAPGLYVGLGGIAVACAELGQLDRAEAAMEAMARSPLLHASPDFFYGAAGWGWACLYLYGMTRNPKHLEQARLAGDFLRASAQREGGACLWPASDGLVYHGLAHGASGIALFLLHLWRSTGAKAYLEDAIAGIEFELSHAIQGEHRLEWTRTLNGNLVMPYWRFGGAGIGTTLVHFARLLGDPRYLRLAEEAARGAMKPFTFSSGQCLGQAGIGELMLDLHALTGDARHLAAAHQATGLLRFGIARPEGIAFPGESMTRLSCDFATGSAGVGVFLDRLRSGCGRLIFELPE